MKLFICEFITAGGLANESLTTGLVHEGDLMLRALLQDCLELDQVEIITTRDRRLPGLSYPIKVLEAHNDSWQLWRDCIQAADAAIIIAPETDGVLYRLTRMVEESDCRLMGCSSETIATTSSKRKTIEKLATTGLTLPVTTTPNQITFNPCQTWVIKPDDGVGGEQCCLISSEEELRAWSAQENLMHDWVAQEYIDGAAASLTLLCCQGEARCLSVNKQCFEFINTVGKLQGVEVNGLYALRGDLEPVIDSVAQCFPGLWGIVGVDFIMTDSGPVVLEINPRLTTSYAGLHQSLQYNPMSYVFRMFNEQVLPAMVHGQSLPVSLQIAEAGL